MTVRNFLLAIVTGTTTSNIFQLVKAASTQLQANYIDLATNLLPKLAVPGFSPTLGAYDTHDLKGWILQKSYQPDTSLVVVDNIEPVLATFERAKTVEFFQVASLLEPIAPVILVTYLTKQVEDSRFPTNRLLPL